MSEPFVKQRNVLGPRISDQAKKRTANNGQRGGGSKWSMAPGQFDRFFADERPCWIHIHDIVHEQQVYDRAEKEVITTRTTWFESNKHFIPRNKGKFDAKGKKKQQDFICSCGPFKKDPCWGCVYRTAFYAKLDAIAEEKGFRPDTKPAVGRSTQFSLSLTIMEKIFAVPLRDKEGNVRKARNSGNIIYRYVPAPFADTEEDAAEVGQNFRHHFGHNMHWTMGTEHLEMLGKFDDDLRTYCGNCASKMLCSKMLCTSCETPMTIETLEGEDINIERKKIRTCKSCGDKCEFFPVYDCPDCGEPKEGRLTLFDIRIMKEKVGEKKSVLRVLAVRMPGAKDDAGRARIKELLDSPLDLSKIFTPTPVEIQAKLLGEDLLEGLSLTAGKDSVGDTESYAGGEDSGDEEEGVAF